ncbi:MAG: hypothetical protein WBF53_09420, partial [Litorimonas sp.]
MLDKLAVTVATPLDQSLFDQTWTEIKAKMLGAGANLQILDPTIDWWFDAAGAGTMSARALNIVNTVPKWSTVGAYSPGASSVFDSYVQVLQHVDPTIPPAQRQAFTNAHNALVTAQATRSQDEQKRNRQWVVDSTGLPAGVPVPDYPTWLIQSGWAGTLKTDSDAISKAQETLGNVIANQDPALKKALLAAAMPADANTKKAGFTTVDQGDGTLVPAPVFSVGTTGQDWVALLSQGGGDKRTITVSQSKSSDNMSKSWAKADTKVSGWFWSVEISGRWEQLDIDQSDASVSATIEMTTTQVDVTPGDWFDGGYLKTLKGQGNFFPPWQATGGASPAFGEGGLLPLQIRQLIVAYQPSFTISMAQSTYNRALKQFQAATNVRIGPFTFAGSGGHTSDKVNTTASNGQFTGKSTATYPF